jgi:LysM repeat protein
MRFTFTTAAFALVAFTSTALAHMEMVDPAPFRSKFNTLIDKSTVDFDMSSPLKPDGSNFPCKNFQGDFNSSPAGDPTATWAAGSPQQVTLDDLAAHDGGSCQFSLSFDGGKTFRVVKSIEGGCVNPKGGKHSFDFTVPADTKSGKVIFAWTWFNHTGNREMYMNCAAVTITGTGTSTLTDRPEIFKANVGNDCSTTERTDVKFPDPGPDVEVLASESLLVPTCTKADSRQPTQSADPTDFADPAEPTDEPTDKPTDEPTDVADPTNSADSTSSVSSVSSANLANPTYSAAPTISDEPTEEPVPTRTSSVSAPTTTPTGSNSPKYTVKAGDICINIAKQQGIPLETLYKLNPDINKDCTNLEIGQDLTIRRRSRIMRNLD